MIWIFGFSPFFPSIPKLLFSLHFSAIYLTYFEKHHAILEKYDVLQPGTAAGGGEYDVQLGFGWTNGIYLKCLEFIRQSG